MTEQFDYQLADTGHRLSITELNGRISEIHRLLYEEVTDPTLGNRMIDFSYDMFLFSLENQGDCNGFWMDSRFLDGYMN